MLAGAPLRLWLLAGLVPALGFLGACADLEQRLFKPRMKVVCHILEGQCVFRNGGDPGESCVVVQLKQLESARVIRSLPVCSGPTATNETRVVQVSWPPTAKPFEFCMGEDLAGNFYQTCGVQLERQERPRQSERR
jgi:hypothetical protein